MPSPELSRRAGRIMGEITKILFTESKHIALDNMHAFIDRLEKVDTFEELCKEDQALIILTETKLASRMPYI